MQIINNYIREQNAVKFLKKKRIIEEKIDENQIPWGCNQKKLRDYSINILTKYLKEKTF